MEIARLYRDAQRSFCELARSLSDADWAQPSPCTPGWRARDLLSHVAGISIDIVEGNVDGAATDPWTAAQVERWRDVSVGELIARWDAAIDQAADAIELFGEVRPPLDCHSHEHDLRTATGRPGNRDSELIEMAASLFLDGGVGRAVTFHFDDGSDVDSPGTDPPLEVGGISRFELVRSRLGRRSANQVRAWAWSDPPGDDVLAAWFMFGPSPLDIVE